MLGFSLVSFLEIFYWASIRLFKNLLPSNRVKADYLEVERKIAIGAGPKYSIPSVPHDIYTRAMETGGVRPDLGMEDEEDYYKMNEPPPVLSRKPTVHIPKSIPRPLSNSNFERKLSSETARKFWDEVWKMSQKKVEEKW